MKTKSLETQTNWINWIFTTFTVFYIWLLPSFMLFTYKAIDLYIYIYVKRCMLRRHGSVLSVHSRLLYVYFCCAFNSLKIKEQIKKYKTKCFCKCCFAVLYKLTISLKQQKRKAAKLSCWSFVCVSLISLL